MLRIWGFRTAVISIFLLGFTACTNKRNEAPEQVQRPSVPDPKDRPTRVLTEDEKQSIKLYAMDNVPSLTVASYSNDIVKTRKVLADAGATVVYDPNDFDGTGQVHHQIPFIIFEIEPSKLLDDSFVQNLNLDIFDLVEGTHSRLRESDPTLVAVDRPEAEPLKPRPFSLPKKEVNLDDLTDRGLAGVGGEEVIVAIADTGIDVTHPFFQNRVIYASDLTEEGKAKVEDAVLSFKQEDSRVVADEMDVTALFQRELASAGENALNLDGYLAKSGAVSESVISEKTLALEPAKVLAADINQDGDNRDSWNVVFLKKGQNANFLAYVDYNNDGVIEGVEEEKGIRDFNSQWRTSSDNRSFFTVKFATKSFQYPLLFNFEKDPNHFTFFADFRGHGTHVAGTVGARDEISGKFSGVAPNVKFMAMKVLGARGSSTGASVSRGILESVINDSPHKADIVNLSLGSGSASGVRLSESLMRDLANVAGTVFVISAGNSGPGFHSINGSGKYGPIISVGAYLSKEMLEDDYVNSGRLDPEGQLYHFSSRGPSFTGELRPNIVAPGGMVSAVPQGRITHMNGTSMSAPLTTGVIASVLSALKAEESESDRPDDEKFWYRQAQVKKGAMHSLTFMPMTVRQALQKSAQKISGRSPIEQGHGLIQAGAFYDELKSKIASQSYVATDLILNGNQALSRPVDAYSRDGIIESNQIFAFSLPLNSRLSSEEEILLKSKPLTLKLTGVWKQGPKDKEFKVIKGGTDNRAWPFYIFTYGDPDTKVFESELNWSSRNQDFFRSARDLDGMDTDTTYMAHYQLSRENEVLMDFVDVVHKPIHLSPSPQKLYSPLDRKLVEEKFALGERDRALKAGEIHRYFVHVPEEIQELELELALETQGMLEVGILGPSGWAEVESFLYWDEARGREIKTQNLIVFAPEPGVYEVVVYPYQSVWTTPMKYSMLLKASQSKISHDEVMLSQTANPTQDVTLLKREDVGESAALNVDLLFPYEVIEGIETLALHETLVSFEVEGGLYLFELMGGGWGTRLIPKIRRQTGPDSFEVVTEGFRPSARLMQVALPSGRYFATIENTNLSYSLREKVSLKILNGTNAQQAGSMVSIEQPAVQEGDLHSFRLKLLPNTPGGTWQSTGTIKWGEHQRSFNLLIKD